MTKSAPLIGMLLALATILALAPACKRNPDSTTPVGAGTPAEKGPSLEKKRPPFPNMATANWGEKILQDWVALEAVKKLPPLSASQNLQRALDALHALSPGSEKQAAQHAAAAFAKASPDDESARSTAIALLAAALCLDPDPNGHRERITDAYGLSAYASTFPTSSPLAQAARALASMAAGKKHDARSLLKLFDNPLEKDPHIHLLLGLARTFDEVWDDATHENLKAALKGRPHSTRAAHLLGTLYLQMGLAEEALALVSPEQRKASETSPLLWAVAGRAQVVQGEVESGIALLRKAHQKAESQHKGPILAWLARSLGMQKDSDDEILGLAENLDGIPGQKVDAALLRAFVAQRRGAYAEARAALQKIKPGPGRLSKNQSARLAWSLTDACAGLGDADCVEGAIHEGTRLDGDHPRGLRAKAALIVLGGMTGGDGGPEAVSKKTTLLEGVFREIHLHAPFDPKLAERVSLSPLATGPHLERRLRAARSALRFSAPGLAATVLHALKKEIPGCGVCHLILAQTEKEGEAFAQHAQKALEKGGADLGRLDLVDLVEAGSKLPPNPVKKALEPLFKDPRAEVQRALVALDPKKHTHAPSPPKP
jgi:tetratricopeptide (TPR) repeat protein